jgi:hypothetical protein
MPRIREKYVHSNGLIRITEFPEVHAKGLIKMRDFILFSACNGDAALHEFFRCDTDSQIIAMNIAERLVSRSITGKLGETIGERKVALIAVICMTIAQQCNELRPDYESSDEAYRDWFKKSFEEEYNGLNMEANEWLLKRQQEKRDKKMNGDSSVMLLSLYEILWSEMKWEICSQIGFYVDFLTPSTWKLVCTVSAVQRYSAYYAIKLENIVASSYGYIYEGGHQVLCSLGGVRKAHPDVVAMTCFLIFLDEIPEGDMVQYVTFMIKSGDEDFYTIWCDEENSFSELLEKPVKKVLERSLKRCIFARLQHSLYGTASEDKQLYTDTCESPLLDPIRQFILRVHEQDALNLERAYGIKERSPSPEF